MNSIVGTIGNGSPLVADASPMIDPFGRAVTYLRVSVTDRCDFRCTYSHGGTHDLPAEEGSADAGRARTGSVPPSSAGGVRKIRLTGGEPLVRKNIMFLVRELGRQVQQRRPGRAHADHQWLASSRAMPKNSVIAACAASTFRSTRSIPINSTPITRWGDFAKVMEGIDAAQKAGLKIKLNAVALRDFNETEMPELLRFAHGRGMDLTVIETMPMGEIEEDRTDRYLPLSKLRADLERQFTLTDIPYKTGGPARYVEVAETGGRLGFITPLTHNFCESCNRVRLDLHRHALYVPRSERRRRPSHGPARDRR